MKTILKEKFAEMVFDEETPCFIIKWYGFQQVALVKPFCERIVVEFGKMLEQNPHCVHFIGDTREIDVVSPDIQVYWQEVWNPAMYAAGGRFLAVLVPSSVFAQFTVEMYSENTNETLREVKVRIFDKVEEAKKWLKTCQIK